MQILIVGAGKVGCSLGKYLSLRDVPIAGFVSRSKESAKQAATFTDTQFFSLKEGLKMADCVFITTPDGEIKNVWNEIKKESIEGKIICHFSGSLSSDLFEGIDKLGAFGASVHPMFAFSDKFTSYKKLNSAKLTIEGDDYAKTALKSLFEKQGNKVFVIDGSKKTRYHLAAFLMCNGMIGLYQMGLDMLLDCGLEENAAKELVRPMVEDNIKSVLEKGAIESITGPMERNDLETVKKHRAVLKETEKDAYKGVGLMLTKIASQKHPDRDYGPMENELQKEV